MALVGTIKDFNLAEIFQMISFQKKTGVLTVKSKTNTVNIYFKEGEIASTDILKRWEEDRLGQVLVNAGKINRRKLKRALEIKKDTKHRIGYILVRENMITKADLSMALQQQMKRLISRLFQWEEVRYRFIAKIVTPYDDLLIPIDTEYILMESARMIDECYSMGNKIPSFDTVLKRVKGKKNNDIYLTEKENRILGLINGKSDIDMVIASSGMDEVEALNILVKLLNNGFIE